MKRSLQLAALAIALLIAVQPALAQSPCGPAGQAARARAANDCAAVPCQRPCLIGLDQAMGAPMDSRMDAGCLAAFASTFAHATTACVQGPTCVPFAAAIAAPAAPHNLRVAGAASPLDAPVAASVVLADYRQGLRAHRRPALSSAANPRYLLLQVIRV